MIPKALIDYQSSTHDVTVVSVSEEVEELAQKISRFAPKYFPSNGVNTYRLALYQLDKGKNAVPYVKLIQIICKDWLLDFFIDKNCTY